MQVILVCSIFIEEYSSVSLIDEKQMVSFETSQGRHCDPTAIRFKEIWYGI